MWEAFADLFPFFYNTCFCQNKFKVKYTIANGKDFDGGVKCRNHVFFYRNTIVIKIINLF